VNAFVERDLGTGPRRWYRTGDLVTTDDEGELHYVSRMDDQVQIGGRRTEPAEIVDAILALPNVTNAVVFTRPTPAGGVRLAVAVTPSSVTRREIHRHLRQLLPAYMIPGEVVAMDRLPLTAHGKIDMETLRRGVTVTPAVVTESTDNGPSAGG
jgi:enterobactin synthetase component F